MEIAVSGDLGTSAGNQDNWKFVIFKKNLSIES